MRSPLLRRFEEIKGISAVVAGEVETYGEAGHIAERAGTITLLEESQEREEGAAGDEADEEKSGVPGLDC